MSTRSSWARRALAAAGVVALVGGAAWAQSSVTEEGKRKVKSKVAPAYPDLARRMNVTGKVKIEVVIAPDGHVKSARALGGHPLLVAACLDAIKGWKYMTAAEESTQVVEFDFTGTE